MPGRGVSLEKGEVDGRRAGRRRVGAALLAAALAAAGLACQGGETGPSTEVPVPFLRERVVEVVDRIEKARSRLPGAPEEAETELAAATLELRRLNEYYLPVLRAWNLADRASRLASVGAPAARAAVDSADAILMEVVRGHGPQLQGEMREPLERLEDARIALSAGDAPAARRTLRRLAAQLESIFFRGDLVLQGSELDGAAAPESDTPPEPDAPAESDTARRPSTGPGPPHSR